MNKPSAGTSWKSWELLKQCLFCAWIWARGVFLLLLFLFLKTSAMINLFDKSWRNKPVLVTIADRAAVHSLCCIVSIPWLAANLRWYMWIKTVIRKMTYSKTNNKSTCCYAPTKKKSPEFLGKTSWLTYLSLCILDQITGHTFLYWGKGTSKSLPYLYIIFLISKE